MLMDLCLIQCERRAAIVAIIAYLFILVSADQAEAQIIAEEKNHKDKNPIGNSAKTAAIGSVLLLINIIILAQIAFTRLREKQEKLMKGEKTDSISPNINLSAGFLIGVLGNLFRAIGALQRSSESGSPIIVL
jgi:uncharacterized protein YacL